jgi:hypothetical protein
MERGSLVVSGVSSNGIGCGGSNSRYRLSFSSCTGDEVLLESRQALISHPIHILIPPCPWSHACMLAWSCQLGDLESMHVYLGSIPETVARLEIDRLIDLIDSIDRFDFDFDQSI